MAGKVAKRAPKRKGANTYKLPDPIPAGEILTDMSKKQWILGTSIGIGGFGEIYSAAPYSGKTPKDYPNVIKIEPRENGPLFVEMHFYMRNAKPNEIDAWQKKKKLSKFGMPRYIGSGSHEYNKTKYRFVVMDRYGKDLWKLFEENNRQFPEHTVYKIALQIINVIEYIHHKLYVHADIKGANLLLDLKSQDNVYLVDFGLASHYTNKNEYKLDPKKAHNGTIEYTSRDAHMGVPTMRGDFEILGYNMIQWLCGSLLWEKNLTDPVAVQAQKKQAFNDVPEFLKKCFHGSVPAPILKYMTLLKSIEFNEIPDYEKFKKILIDGLKELSHKPEGKLEFKTSRSTPYKSQPLKPTPQKQKISVATVKRSPRVKLLKLQSPVASLDDSTIGIVLDKKRGGANDIKQILDDIESDEEYDIKITKKKKIKSEPNSIHTNSIKTEKTKTVRMRKAKKNYIESESESELEVISKGTKSRPKNIRKVTPVKTKTPRKKLLASESNSDEDMFDE